MLKIAAVHKNIAVKIDHCICISSGTFVTFSMKFVLVPNVLGAWIGPMDGNKSSFQHSWLGDFRKSLEHKYQFRKSKQTTSTLSSFSQSCHKEAKHHYCFFQFSA